MNKEISVITKIHKKVSELTVDDIATCCEKNGVTIDSLCSKLKDLLNATREIKDRDGDLVDTLPDNNVQLKALTVALELLKLVGSKDVKVSGTVEHKHFPVEDLPKLEAAVKEMARLREVIKSSPIQQGIEDATVRSI